MKIFVLKLILFTFILDIYCVIINQDIIETCKDKCINLSKDLEESSWTCDSTCSVEQCDNGCSLWQQAVKSTCLDSCNESHNISNKEVQHCTAGCNLAVDIYAQEVKDALAKLSSPELVSKQNESVILMWKGDAALTVNVSRHLQKKVPGLISEWQDHHNIEWLHNHQVKVHGLRPYTTYKFRIVIDIVKARHSMWSPPSFDITTEQFGVPVEPPTIVNLATGSTSLHIKLKPPFYINARVVGYEIDVTKVQPEGAPAGIVTTQKFVHDGMVKSVVISNSDLNHETTAIITRLEPNTEYKVKVMLRNENGVGPAVVSYKRTKEANNAWHEAMLIYGADNSVLKQYPRTIVTDTEVLFHTGSHNIYVTGLAFHYHQNKIFVSVSSGSVYSVDLGATNEGSGGIGSGSSGGTTNNNKGSKIYQSNNKPKALNVDWLNDKLYIAEEDKIVQCSLTGTECITAISDLNSRPEDIKVDPGSGYLFWVQNGYGICRRELTQLAEDATTESDDRIITVGVINAITIDHTNFRIFYANESTTDLGNTLMSANFDGSDIMDIRQGKVENPDFIMVQSITHVNRLFVWTNGKAIQLEEKNSFTNSIYHQQISMEVNRLTGFNIWHPSAQPTPVPFMAPRNLQVVLSETSARLTWDPPGNSQGDGGYNTWQYEIEEVNKRSSLNHTLTISNVSLYHNFTNMTSDTIYGYRVRAFSSAGKGPWCTAFEGSTLKNGSSASIMYVVDSENALYLMQLNGYDLNLNDTYMGSETLNELEIHEGRRLWSSTDGNMYREHSPVGDLSDVKTFAYDWIGNALYWAPTRTTATIRRLSLHNLVDNLSESVVQEAKGNSVENLVVDALQGYIYWTTLLSVEAARLDGRAARLDGRDLSITIFTIPNAYSGKYVMGIAINYEESYLYWLLKAGDMTSLYRVPLFHFHEDSSTNKRNSFDSTTVEHLFEFHTMSVPLKIQYYSHKLFWKGAGSHELEILDVKTQSLASISLETSGNIRAFVVDYPNKYIFPDGLNSNNIRVIPPSVSSKNIRLTGEWDNFDIIWDPSFVNYGEIYYEVLLSSEKWDREIPKVTVEPHLSYLAGFDPYTLLKVTLKACTKWGCSGLVEHQLYTPMSAPSLPGRTRTYVTHHEGILSSNKEIEVEFHWDEPDPANGLIESYIVQMAVDEKGPWSLKDIEGYQNYFVTKDAKNNSFYYFKVRACTKKACSEFTDVITANTTVQKPVPKLLTTSDNSIKMFLPDEKEEAKRSRTLENDQVCAVTYIAREDTYFWLNKRGTIVRKDSRGNTTKVTTTSNTGNSLTVDWVGRDLYWAEQKQNQNAIVRFDLNQFESKPTIVLSMITVVWKLDISPYRSSLYWTESESEDSESKLMTSDLEGTHRRSFFAGSSSRTERDRVRRQQCTCTGVPISKVFVIDNSGGKDAELYFVEQGTKTIWASDLDGCICRIVLNGTQQSTHLSTLGLPPDSMTLDQEHLYWSNSQTSSLYSVNKWSGEGLEAVLQDTRKLGNLKNIVAYGDHLQPMPDTKCLLIESYTSTPALISSSNTSLMLKIEPWTPSAECSGISIPTVKYTIHYKQDDGDIDFNCNMTDVHCKKKESYKLEVELTELKPFKSYMVQLSVTNYYMENRGRRPVFARPVIFSTKTGVPSRPRRVLAVATNPTRINITWHSPAHPNANYADLIYVLEYYYNNRTDDRTSSRVEITGVPYQGDGVGLFYMYYVDSLKPATLYTFRILARTKDNRQFNNSETFWEITYQQPAIVRHVNHTHNSITVRWNSSTDGNMVRHRIEYIEYSKIAESPAPWITQEWNSNQTKKATEYIQTFSGLQSYTEYAFRVTVKYRSTEDYTWPKEITKRHVFQTEASLPAPPKAPQVENTSGGVRKVVWNEPYNGGINIMTYKLFARTVDDYNWTNVYNGSERHWIMEGLLRGHTYIFAVAAKNELGWSHLSESSSPHLFVQPVAVIHSGSSEKMTLVLSVLFAVIFLIIVAMMLMLLLRRRYRDPKTKQFSLVNGFRHPTDMELATLREMPRVAMQSNALYAINIVPTDEGIAALPHYHREDLTLTKFLGSGAFGEVYEGIATNILSNDSGETKVAVKALKKGATDNEKEEFLKEALLMSNFKHEHILSLLGVCLHNDPQFLILELMAGGDLLTYLRVSRSTSSNSATLELFDMVSICVDVAKGCKYLEELHFVHRDLAARNCLVNKKDNGERIVKIGDFGLARDIYKSDYYRKEGEGLMPVRWMSPESLVDGVFTTHSDVWAFGVLIWEVLTLGQQPYPARTNLDVLNYVRRGGRLDRPDNCPDDMYDLMVKCWYYNPDARPSFRSVLCQLETFKQKSQNPASAFCVRRAPPTSVRPAGHDNKNTSHFGAHHGETDSAKSKNLKGSNVKRSFSFDMKGRFGIYPSSSKSSNEGSGYLEPLVPAGEENKYLELLGGNEPTHACLKCGRLGCDERCHRGLLRHSSDCTHSLRSVNKRLQQQKSKEESKVSHHKKGKGGKGKLSKSKKCDKVFNDSGSSTSGTGSGMESLPEDSADDTSSKVKTIKGTRYHNVATNQENPWLIGNVMSGGSTGESGPPTSNSNSVPGFLIHPPMLVKRTSFTPSEVDSSLSLSIPPDFDELAPNNRSSVDSNSPLLTWGSTQESPLADNDKKLTYQNGFLVAPNFSNKKYHQKDLDYLRQAANVHSNLETSGESLV